MTDHVSVSVGAAPEREGQSESEETEKADPTGCVCEPVGKSGTCGGKNSSPGGAPNAAGARLGETTPWDLVGRWNR